MADDEISLPPLPPPTSPSRISGRKRARGLGRPLPPDCSFSSDPAVFSSDDDPALDNYIQGRRKKRYVGSWFYQLPASSDSAIGEDNIASVSRPLPSLQKRRLTRKLDSGVWMGFDSLDTDDCIDFEASPAKLAMIRKSRKLNMSPSEMDARRMIQACIGTGDENIDLTGLRIDKLSNETILPLSEIAPIPIVAKNVAFETRDPSIRLFLASNMINTLPGALMNLEHLTVLSLRGNRLTELPPAISHLKRLTNLNVAQNSLQYLPAELLELMNKGSALADCQLHPNPFWQPQDHGWCEWGIEEYEGKTFGRRLDKGKDSTNKGVWTGITTCLRSRTPVQYNDNGAALASGFVFPRGGAILASDPGKLPHEDFWKLEDPPIQYYTPPTVCRVPMLSELALRAAVRSSEARELEAMLEGDLIPSHLPALMKQAVHVYEMGGQQCCVCGMSTLMPLTEWVEFREVRQTTIKTVIVRNGNVSTSSTRAHGTANKSERWVPFMRKGCSWNCVPHKSIEPPAGTKKGVRKEE